MSTAIQPEAMAALRRLTSEPWAMAPEWLESLRVTTEAAASGSLENLIESLESDPMPLHIGGGVAEIRISGTMMRAPDVFERIFLGACDMSLLRQRLGEVADMADVSAVLLNIDSPGGTVNGTEETADAVQALAKRKPVVAYTEGTMASAAYWIGSAANVIVASKSSTVGSIGVALPFLDMRSAFEKAGLKMDVLTNDGAIFKGAGVRGTSLTDDQRNQLVGNLNSIFENFRGAVTRARPGVKLDAMRGQTFYGWNARAAGLVDAIGDYMTAWKHASSLAPRN